MAGVVYHRTFPEAGKELRTLGGGPAADTGAPEGRPRVASKTERDDAKRDFMSPQMMILARQRARRRQDKALLNEEIPRGLVYVVWT